MRDATEEETIDNGMATDAPGSMAKAAAETFRQCLDRVRRSAVTWKTEMKMIDSPATIHDLRSKPMTVAPTKTYVAALETEVQAALKRHDAERASEHDIGRLSAEAVLSQYEAAAKAVEGMGEEIKERIQRLEAALKECDKDMNTVEEAAKAIREKGKLVYMQIQEASGVSDAIRNACAEFHKKVSA